jgi:hypothetical protein
MTSFPSFLSAVLLAQLLGPLPQDTLYPVEASLSGSLGSASIDTTEPFQLSVSNREGLIDFEVWADADAEHAAMVRVWLDLSALQAGETEHTAVVGRSGTDPWNWAFEEQAERAVSRIEPLGLDRTLLVVDAEFSAGQRVHAEIELSSRPE